jgi:flavodoxin
VLLENGKSPLVVYYSRSGKTRLVAEAISKAMAAEVVEITSKKNREGIFGIFTCVLDQLMDRDDEQLPLSLDLASYDPIYIASPIWLHKMSSPAMTFIKNAVLTGKQVYIVLTYNGSQMDEDEKKLKGKVLSCGVAIKELYKIKTKEKDLKELEKEAAGIAEKFNQQLVKN